MVSFTAFVRSKTLLVVLGAGIAGLFGGCVAPGSRVSYRTAANTTREAANIHSIAVLPLDVEVAELNAGGISEKRDDWTVKAIDNLNRAITRFTSCKPVNASAKLPEADLAEIHALFRAITQNQFFHGFFGPALITSVRGPLVYQMGSMDSLLDSTKSDAVLIVFIRDDHATGGRRTLSIIGDIAGIPVRTGITISSAALVSRDGTLLWMNCLGAKASSDDIRDQDGADEAVKNLFAGLPALAAR